ncbi:MAG: hypothetical protein K0Q46_2710 [Rhodococcus erythropolis]|nr:hypothetical protein [Rhodococcus erythropolis]MDF2895924.1 hypothetical protein [Rhodococcus erythropolis]
MQDVRRGMTDTELVDEATRLARHEKLARCDEIRLALVLDELTSRSAKSHNPQTAQQRRN